MPVIWSAWVSERKREKQGREEKGWRRRQSKRERERQSESRGGRRLSCVVIGPCFAFSSLSLFLSLPLFAFAIVSCVARFRFIFSPVTSWVFLHFHLKNSSITGHTQTGGPRPRAKETFLSTLEPVVLASQLAKKSEEEKEREREGRRKEEITHTHPNFLTSAIILSVYEVNFSTKWYIQHPMYTWNHEYRK